MFDDAWAPLTTESVLNSSFLERSRLLIDEAVRLRTIRHKSLGEYAVDDIMHLLGPLTPSPYSGDGAFGAKPGLHTHRIDDMSLVGIHMMNKDGLFSGMTRMSDKVSEHVIYSLCIGEDFDTSDDKGSKFIITIAHPDMDTNKFYINILERYPIRVVRSCTSQSPYAPPTGFRYDGLYFVTGYYQDLDPSGVICFRFVFESAHTISPTNLGVNNDLKISLLRKETSRAVLSQRLKDCMLMLEFYRRQFENLWAKYLKSYLTLLENHYQNSQTDSKEQGEGHNNSLFEENGAVNSLLYAKKALTSNGKFKQKKNSKKQKDIYDKIETLRSSLKDYSSINFRVVPSKGEKKTSNTLLGSSIKKQKIINDLQSHSKYTDNVYFRISSLISSSFHSKDEHPSKFFHIDDSKVPITNNVSNNSNCLPNNMFEPQNSPLSDLTPTSTPTPIVDHNNISSNSKNDNFPINNNSFINFTKPSMNKSCNISHSSLFSSKTNSVLPILSPVRGDLLKSYKSLADAQLAVHFIQADMIRKQIFGKGVGISDPAPHLNVERCLTAMNDYAEPELNAMSIKTKENNILTRNFDHSKKLTAHPSYLSVPGFQNFRISSRRRNLYPRQVFILSQAEVDKLVCQRKERASSFRGENFLCGIDSSAVVSTSVGPYERWSELIEKVETQGLVTNTTPAWRQLGGYYNAALVVCNESSDVVVTPIPRSLGPQIAYGDFAHGDLHKAAASALEMVCRYTTEDGRPHQGLIQRQVRPCEGGGEPSEWRIHVSSSSQVVGGSVSRVDGECEGLGEAKSLALGTIKYIQEGEEEKGEEVAWAGGLSGKVMHVGGKNSLLVKRCPFIGVDTSNFDSDSCSSSSDDDSSNSIQELITTSVRTSNVDNGNNDDDIEIVGESPPLVKLPVDDNYKNMHNNKIPAIAANVRARHPPPKEMFRQYNNPLNKFVPLSASTEFASMPMRDLRTGGLIWIGIAPIPSTWQTMHLKLPHKENALRVVICHHLRDSLRGVPLSQLAWGDEEFDPQFDPELSSDGDDSTSASEVESTKDKPRQEEEFDEQVLSNPLSHANQQQKMNNTHSSTKKRRLGESILKKNSNGGGDNHSQSEQNKHSVQFSNLIQSEPSAFAFTKNDSSLTTEKEKNTTPMNQTFPISRPIYLLKKGEKDFFGPKISQIRELPGVSENLLLVRRRKILQGISGTIGTLKYEIQNVDKMDAEACRGLLSSFEKTEEGRSILESTLDWNFILKPVVEDEIQRSIEKTTFPFNPFDLPLSVVDMLLPRMSNKPDHMFSNLQNAKKTLAVLARSRLTLKIYLIKQFLKKISIFQLKDVDPLTNEALATALVVYLQSLPVDQNGFWRAVFPLKNEEAAHLSAQSVFKLVCLMGETAQMAIQSKLKRQQQQNDKKLNGISRQDVYDDEEVFEPYEHIVRAFGGLSLNASMKKSQDRPSHSNSFDSEFDFLPKIMEKNAINKERLNSHINSSFKARGIYDFPPSQSFKHGEWNDEIHEDAAYLTSITTQLSPSEKLIIQRMIQASVSVLNSTDILSNQQQAEKAIAHPFSQITAALIAPLLPYQQAGADSLFGLLRNTQTVGEGSGWLKEHFWKNIISHKLHDVIRSDLQYFKSPNLSIPLIIKHLVHIKERTLIKQVEHQKQIMIMSKAASDNSNNSSGSNSANSNKRPKHMLHDGSERLKFKDDLFENDDMLFDFRIQPDKNGSFVFTEDPTFLNMDSSLSQVDNLFEKSQSTKNGRTIKRTIRGNTSMSHSNTQKSLSDNHKPSSEKVHTENEFYLLENHVLSPGFDFLDPPPPTGEIGTVIKSRIMLELMAQGHNIVMADVSFGDEVLPIPAVNDFDQQPPTDFAYSARNFWLRNVVFDNSTIHPYACIGCQIGNKHIGHDDEGGEIDVNTGVFVPCGESCACTPINCRNRMSRGLQLPLYVCKTKHKGWELRTLRPIKSGQVIFEFRGELTTSKEHECRTQWHASIRAHHMNFGINFDVCPTDAMPCEPCGDEKCIHLNPDTNVNHVPSNIGVVANGTGYSVNNNNNTSNNNNNNNNSNNTTTCSCVAAAMDDPKLRASGASPDWIGRKNKEEMSAELKYFEEKERVRKAIQKEKENALNNKYEKLGISEQVQKQEQSNTIVQCGENKSNQNCSDEIDGSDEERIARELEKKTAHFLDRVAMSVVEIAEVKRQRYRKIIQHYLNKKSKEEEKLNSAMRVESEHKTDDVSVDDEKSMNHLKQQHDGEEEWLTNKFGPLQAYLADDDSDSIDSLQSPRMLKKKQDAIFWNDKEIKMDENTVPSLSTENASKSSNNQIKNIDIASNKSFKNVECPSGILPRFGYKSALKSILDDLIPPNTSFVEDMLLYNAINLQIEAAVRKVRKAQVIDRVVFRRQRIKEIRKNHNRNKSDPPMSSEQDKQLTAKRTLIMSSILQTASDAFNFAARPSNLSLLHPQYLLKSAPLNANKSEYSRIVARTANSPYGLLLSEEEGASACGSSDISSGNSSNDEDILMLHHTAKTIRKESVSSRERIKNSERAFKKIELQKAWISAGGGNLDSLLSFARLIDVEDETLRLELWHDTADKTGLRKLLGDPDVWPAHVKHILFPSMANTDSSSLLLENDEVNVLGRLSTAKLCSSVVSLFKNHLSASSSSSAEYKSSSTIKKTLIPKKEKKEKPPFSYAHVKVLAGQPSLDPDQIAIHYQIVDPNTIRSSSDNASAIPAPSSIPSAVNATFGAPPLKQISHPGRSVFHIPSNSSLTRQVTLNASASSCPSATSSTTAPLFFDEDAVSIPSTLPIQPFIDLTPWVEAIPLANKLQDINTLQTTCESSMIEGKSHIENEKTASAGVEYIHTESDFELSDESTGEDSILRRGRTTVFSNKLIRRFKTESLCILSGLEHCSLRSLSDLSINVSALHHYVVNSSYSKDFSTSDKQQVTHLYKQCMEGMEDLLNHRGLVGRVYSHIPQERVDHVLSTCKVDSAKGSLAILNRSIGYHLGTSVSLVQDSLSTAHRGGGLLHKGDLNPVVEGESLALHDSISMTRFNDPVSAVNWSVLATDLEALMHERGIMADSQLAQMVGFDPRVLPRLAAMGNISASKINTPSDEDSGDVSDLVAEGREMNSGYMKDLAVHNTKKLFWRKHSYTPENEEKDSTVQIENEKRAQMRFSAKNRKKGLWASGSAFVSFRNKPVNDSLFDDSTTNLVTSVLNRSGGGKVNSDVYVYNNINSNNFNDISILSGQIQPLALPYFSELAGPVIGLHGDELYRLASTTSCAFDFTATGAMSFPLLADGVGCVSDQNRLLRENTIPSSRSKRTKILSNTANPKVDKSIAAACSELSSSQVNVMISPVTLFTNTVNSISSAPISRAFQTTSKSNNMNVPENTGDQNNNKNLNNVHNDMTLNHKSDLSVTNNNNNNDLEPILSLPYSNDAKYPLDRDVKLALTEGSIFLTRPQTEAMVSNMQTPVVAQEYFGNAARFMNHSCSPNVAVKMAFMSSSCAPTLVVVALEDIPAHTPLEWDYTDSYSMGLCHCGSVNCRQILCFGEKEKEFDFKSKTVSDPPHIYHDVMQFMRTEMENKIKYAVDMKTDLPLSKLCPWTSIVGSSTFIENTQNSLIDKIRELKTEKANKANVSISNNISDQKIQQSTVSCAASNDVAALISSSTKQENQSEVDQTYVDQTVQICSASESVDFSHIRGKVMNINNTTKIKTPIKYQSLFKGSRPYFASLFVDGSDSEEEGKSAKTLYNESNDKKNMTSEFIKTEENNNLAPNLAFASENLNVCKVEESGNSPSKSSIQEDQKAKPFNVSISYLRKVVSKMKNSIGTDLSEETRTKEEWMKSRSSSVKKKLTDVLISRAKVEVNAPADISLTIKQRHMCDYNWWAEKENTSAKGAGPSGLVEISSSLSTNDKVEGMEFDSNDANKKNQSGQLNSLKNPVEAGKLLSTTSDIQSAKKTGPLSGDLSYLAPSALSTKKVAKHTSKSGSAALNQKQSQKTLGANANTNEVVNTKNVGNNNHKLFWKQNINGVTFSEDYVPIQVSDLPGSQPRLGIKVTNLFAKGSNLDCLPSDPSSSSSSSSNSTSSSSSSFSDGDFETEKDANQQQNTFVDENLVSNLNSDSLKENIQLERNYLDQLSVIPPPPPFLTPQSCPQLSSNTVQTISPIPNSALNNNINDDDCLLIGEEFTSKSKTLENWLGISAKFSRISVSSPSPTSAKRRVRHATSHDATNSPSKNSSSNSLPPVVMKKQASLDDVLFGTSSVHFSPAVCSIRPPPDSDSSSSSDDDILMLMDQPQVGGEDSFKTTWQHFGFVAGFQDNDTNEKETDEDPKTNNN